MGHFCIFIISISQKKNYYRSTSIKANGNTQIQINIDVIMAENIILSSLLSTMCRLNETHTRTFIQDTQIEIIVLLRLLFIG